MQTLDNNIQIENTLIAMIDGSEHNTLKSFYYAIAQALHFPNYFTHNLDSFDELVSDLSWIEEENILIVIYNINHFLIDEDEELKPIVLDILTQAEENLIGLQVYTK